jgi:hypothetical protein
VCGVVSFLSLTLLTKSFRPVYLLLKLKRLYIIYTSPFVFVIPDSIQNMSSSSASNNSDMCDFVVCRPHPRDTPSSPVLSTAIQDHTHCVLCTYHMPLGDNGSDILLIAKKSDMHQDIRVVSLHEHTVGSDILPAPPSPPATAPLATAPPATAPTSASTAAPTPTPTASTAAAASGAVNSALPVAYAGTDVKTVDNSASTASSIHKIIAELLPSWLGLGELAFPATSFALCQTHHDLLSLATPKPTSGKKSKSPSKGLRWKKWKAYVARLVDQAAKSHTLIGGSGDILVGENVCKSVRNVTRGSLQDNDDGSRVRDTSSRFGKVVCNVVGTATEPSISVRGSSSDHPDVVDTALTLSLDRSLGGWLCEFDIMCFRSRSDAPLSAADMNRKYPGSQPPINPSPPNGAVAVPVALGVDGGGTTSTAAVTSTALPVPPSHPPSVDAGAIASASASAGAGATTATQAMSSGAATQPADSLLSPSSIAPVFSTGAPPVLKPSGKRRGPKPVAAKVDQSVYFIDSFASLESMINYAFRGHICFGFTTSDSGQRYRIGRCRWRLSKAAEHLAYFRVPRRSCTACESAQRAFHRDRSSKRKTIADKEANDASAVASAAARDFAVYDPKIVLQSVGDESTDNMSHDDLKTKFDLMKQALQYCASERDVSDDTLAAGAMNHTAENEDSKQQLPQAFSAIAHPAMPAMPPVPLGTLTAGAQQKRKALAEPHDSASQYQSQAKKTKLDEQQ